MGCTPSRSSLNKRLPVRNADPPPNFGRLDIRATGGPSSTSASTASTSSRSGRSSPSHPPSARPRRPSGGVARDGAVAGLLRAKRHQAVVPVPAEGADVGDAGEAAELAAAALRRAAAAPKEPSLHAFLVAALRSNMFFSALSERALRDVAAAMEPRDVAAGAVLLRQGEAGDDMFVVQSGRLEVAMAPGGEAGGGAPRRFECGEGCGGSLLVGELALLFGTPRTATVAALTNARLWRMDRVAFRAIVAVDQAADHEHVKAALRRGVLADLEEAQLARVAAAAHVVRFAGGEQVIKKGDPGEVFYIIDSGSVICTDLPGEQRDNVLTAGDYFGERALLTREARACNVFAEGDVSLVALHRDDFEALLGHLRDLMDHNAGMRLLLCCPWLAPLGTEDKVALFRHLRLLAFKAGQILLAQGAAVSQFFVIKGGAVNVWATRGGAAGEGGASGALAAKLGRAASARSIAAGGGGGGGAPPPPPPPEGLEGASFLGTLGAGQWFGEEEVAELGPARAFFVAAEATQVFVLDADTYRLYLAQLLPPPGSGRRAERGGGSGARDSKGGTGAPAAGTRAAAASQKPRTRLNIPFKELELRTTLGTGTFGRVRIAFHRPSQRVFALKMLQKSQIVEFKQQANIMNEKELLWRISHPFIIQLFDTYKDKDRLYMLLEVVQGGELFARLQNSPTAGRVTASEARFYSACVLDALAYLHASSIVYRDLKPENLLIDAEGYLKLVDFGFAKVVKDRSYTVCGTPEYLAPELVLGKGHGAGVDYWALGILLFEMVVGYSPFADQANSDQMVICKNILRAAPEFPAHVKDRDLRDLVLALLAKDPAKRLGCMLGGAEEVRAHPFFRHVDWDAMVAKRAPAPWRPLLASPLDTSNFDSYDEHDACEPYVDDGTQWDASFAHL